MADWTCDSLECGSTWPDGSRFCGECGRPRPRSAVASPADAAPASAPADLEGTAADRASARVSAIPASATGDASPPESLVRVAVVHAHSASRPVDDAAVTTTEARGAAEAATLSVAPAPSTAAGLSSVSRARGRTHSGGPASITAPHGSRAATEPEALSDDAFLPGFNMLDMGELRLVARVLQASGVFGLRTHGFRCQPRAAHGHDIAKWLRHSGCDRRSRGREEATAIGQALIQAGLMRCVDVAAASVALAAEAAAASMETFGDLFGRDGGAPGAGSGTGTGTSPRSLSSRRSSHNGVASAGPPSFSDGWDLFRLAADDAAPSPPPLLLHLRVRGAVKVWAKSVGDTYTPPTTVYMRRYTPTRRYAFPMIQALVGGVHSASAMATTSSAPIGYTETDYAGPRGENVRGAARPSRALRRCMTAALAALSCEAVWQQEHVGKSDGASGGLPPVLLAADQILVLECVRSRGKTGGSVLLLPAWFAADAEEASRRARKHATGSSSGSRQFVPVEPVQQQGAALLQPATGRSRFSTGSRAASAPPGAPGPSGARREDLATPDGAAHREAFCVFQMPGQSDPPPAGASLVLQASVGDPQSPHAASLVQALGARAPLPGDVALLAAGLAPDLGRAPRRHGWACPACTHKTPLFVPSCEVCGGSRPDDAVRDALRDGLAVFGDDHDDDPYVESSTSYPGSVHYEAARAAAMTSLDTLAGKAGSVEQQPPAPAAPTATDDPSGAALVGESVSAESVDGAASSKAAAVEGQTPMMSGPVASRSATAAADKPASTTASHSAATASTAAETVSTRQQVPALPDPTEAQSTVAAPWPLVERGSRLRWNHRLRTSWNTEWTQAEVFVTLDHLEASRATVVKPSKLARAFGSGATEVRSTGVVDVWVTVSVIESGKGVPAVHDGARDSAARGSSHTVERSTHLPTHQDRTVVMRVPERADRVSFPATLLLQLPRDAARLKSTKLKWEVVCRGPGTGPDGIVVAKRSCYAAALARNIDGDSPSRVVSSLTLRRVVPSSAETNTPGSETLLFVHPCPHGLHLRPEVQAIGISVGCMAQTYRYQDALGSTVLLREELVESGWAWVAASRWLHARHEALSRSLAPQRARALGNDFDIGTITERLAPLSVEYRAMAQAYGKIAEGVARGPYCWRDPVEDATKAKAEGGVGGSVGDDGAKTALDLDPALSALLSAGLMSGVPGAGLTFKASKLKSVPALAAVATNCHLQLFAAVTVSSGVSSGSLGGLVLAAAEGLSRGHSGGPVTHSGAAPTEIRSTSSSTAEAAERGALASLADGAVRGIVTVGAPSAHRYKFDDGGTRRQHAALVDLTDAAESSLREAEAARDVAFMSSAGPPSARGSIVARADDVRVWERINGGLGLTGVKVATARSKKPEPAGSDDSGPRVQDLRWRTRASWLLSTIIARHDMAVGQALGALFASFGFELTSAARAALSSGNRRTRHVGIRRLRAFQHVGFVIGLENLLSTFLAERGMIEDAMDAWAALRRFRIRLMQVPGGIEGAPGIAGRPGDCTIERVRDWYVVDFVVPAWVWAVLPDGLKAGACISVTPVMFSQGINEMQRAANTVSSTSATSLQFDGNCESISALVRHCCKLRRFKSEIGLKEQELLVIEAAVRALAVTCTPSRSAAIHTEILTTSSDLVARLGGGRVTCCKSAKDRTSMSVTLEQARFLRAAHGFCSPTHHTGAAGASGGAGGADDAASGTDGCGRFNPCDKEVDAANVMRLAGVRLANAAKNTGKAKFAFNGLQRKLLPRAYRPPDEAAGANDS